MRHSADAFKREAREVLSALKGRGGDSSVENRKNDSAKNVAWAFFSEVAVAGVEESILNL